jgi:hypothetical protein
MRKNLFVALISMALTASSALAGDLVTPVLAVGVSHGATCRVLNITTTAIPAQIQLWTTGGVLIVDTGPITVAAGSVASVSETPGSTNGVYCRFVKASKSKTRCSLSLYGTLADGSDDILIPAN